ncbi:SusC/RagA family TonB-linked outer membrane protein [Pedobacter duraquae]|uniref:TonB-dependent receptor-like protein n=1 Tax=Pedobacter duraquae TaxID=425511 RepID=A0A4R6IJY9_9SPHI|nr:TonB-dependent receptor plug domain-containing protein [Pedobacter duraquae]TDO22359.1 TonB-dependent receptor-like protein [Pedobacter duraquae]
MKIKALILFSLIMLSVKLGAQTSSGNTILQDIELYNKQVSPEKVYVQSDNVYYATGDTIWFKGYVVYAKNNVPAENSKILQLDLVDLLGQVKMRVTVPIELGLAAGTLVVPGNLPSANYLLRAYTKHIKNTDQRLTFQKVLRVINTNDRSAASIANVDDYQTNLDSTSTGLDVEFYPESGELVNGLRATVAFRARYSHRRNIRIKGNIVNNLNHIMAKFESDSNGIGSFEFTPLSSTIYFAEIVSGNQTLRKRVLSTIKNEGYVIHVELHNPDTLNVILQTTKRLMNKDEVVLLPLNNGVPLFVFKTNFPDSVVSLAIPKAKLPEGLIQFTLFNSTKNPVTSRLVYNRIETALDIKIPGLKKIYTTREPVQLEIAVTDKYGKPTLGNFSVSAINSSFFPVDENTKLTINSNLLLSSNVLNYVKNANYYFADANADKDLKLNQLLIMEKLRLPDWTSNVIHSLKSFNENHFQLKGQIVSKSKDPVSGAAVTILAGELSKGVLLDTITDSRGHFIFNLPDSLIYKPLRLDISKKIGDFEVLTENNEIDQIVSTNHLKEFADYFSVTDESNFKAIASERSLINQNAAKTIHLNEVKVSGARPVQKLPKESRSLNLNGPGQADQIFTSDFLSKLSNWSQVFPMLIGFNKDLHLISNAGTNAPPLLILVDGVQGMSLEGINLSDVESIEVLRSIDHIGIYGIRGSGGVMIVTTKLPGKTKMAQSRGKIIQPLFSIPKQFFVPQYAKAEINSMHDLRTTVFWSPNLTTGIDGKATFNYVNGDLPGNYTITIEGITPKGEVFSKVFKYEVVKNN